MSDTATSVSMATNGSHPQRWYESYSANLPLNDALPYFDREIETHPGLQAKVEKAIKDEMTAMKAAVKNDEAESRLPPATIDIFKDHPELAKEVERVGKGERLRSIDSSRFQLPAPANGIEEASEEEWTRAVENAATQLMHQDGRLTNIELLKKYGSNAWRLHNFQQEHLSSQYSKASQELTAQITALNRKRRQDQTDAGEKLANLERKWTELISRGLQLEVANLSAEHEIQALELELERVSKEVEALQ